MSQLPIKNISKNKQAEPISTKVFFDRYYSRSINLLDDDITSVTGFFESRGFDKSAALSTGIVLLNQAKNDNVNIFKLLDNIRLLSNVQLNQLVAEILNYNRSPSSVVGFRKSKLSLKTESRNIIEDSTQEIIINTSTENNFSSTGYTFDSNNITFDGE